MWCLSKNLVERAWTTFIWNFVPIPRYISTLLVRREVILISVEGGWQNTCNVRATCRNILCDLIKHKIQMRISLRSFHHKSDTYIEVHFSFHTAVRHYYFNLNYTVYDHTAQFGLNYGWFKRLGKLWTPTKRSYIAIFDEPITQRSTIFMERLLFYIQYN